MVLFLFSVLKIELQKYEKIEKQKPKNGKYFPHTRFVKKIIYRYFVKMNML